MKTEFRTIDTERFLLDKINPNDVHEIFALRSDVEMMQYIPRPMAQNIEDAAKLIAQIQSGNDNQDSVNWGIRWKENGKIIGTIGFVRMQLENRKAELGYMLHKDHFRKGIMTEAVEIVLKYGFETLRLHRIEAVIDPRNIASEKLLLNQGFIKEGHFKENVFFNNEYLDSVYYALLK